MAKTVLIVEDDPTIMEMLENVFEMGGYNMIKAYDLEDFRTHMAAGKPDLVFTDNDIVGSDTGDGLREVIPTCVKADIPVILHSANAEPEKLKLAAYRIAAENQGIEIPADIYLAEIEAQLKPGTIDFIKKPSNPRDVLARTESLINQRASIAGQVGSLHDDANQARNDTKPDMPEH